MKNYNFLQPFAVEISEEVFPKFQKEYLPKLLEVGYCIWDMYRRKGFCLFLVSNCVGVNKNIGFGSNLRITNHDRILLPKDNLDLMLAVAYMTDKEDGVEDEWLYCASSLRIYRGFPPMYNGDRKATLPEILNHFGYYLDGKEVKELKPVFDKIFVGDYVKCEDGNEGVVGRIDTEGFPCTITQYTVNGNSYIRDELTKTPKPTEITPQEREEEQIDGLPIIENNGVKHVLFEEKQSNGDTKYITQHLSIYKALNRKPMEITPQEWQEVRDELKALKKSNKKLKKQVKANKDEIYNQIYQGNDINSNFNERIDEIERNIKKLSTQEGDQADQTENQDFELWEWVETVEEGDTVRISFVDIDDNHRRYLVSNEKDFFWAGKNQIKKIER